MLRSYFVVVADVGWNGSFKWLLKKEKSTTKVIQNMHIKTVRLVFKEATFPINKNKMLCVNTAEEQKSSFV